MIDQMFEETHSNTHQPSKVAIVFRVSKKCKP